MVTFSPVMAKADRAIKAFMFPKVYRHERVMVIRREAAGVVERLFYHFMSEPTHLPADWACVVAASDEPAGARMICDYIAGMTDRYALAEHKRLFGAAPELR
jgi:dGTPase